LGKYPSGGQKCCANCKKKTRGRNRIADREKRKKKNQNKKSKKKKTKKTQMVMGESGALGKENGIKKGGPGTTKHGGAKEILRTPRKKKRKTVPNQKINHVGVGNQKTKQKTKKKKKKKQKKKHKKKKKQKIWGGVEKKLSPPIIPRKKKKNNKKTRGPKQKKIINFVGWEKKKTTKKIRPS